MAKGLVILLLSCLLLHIAVEAKPTQKTPQKNKLLLLIMDAMRWDYLEKYKNMTRNINLMANEGVRAKRLTPPFPSVTCTGLTTIFTGHYAENHGIIGNYMYDPDLDTRFPAVCAKLSTWFHAVKGEFLPITAAKQGFKVATLPEGDLPVQKPPSTMITSAINKLINEDYDAAVVHMLGLDNSGHGYGPLTGQTEAALKILDDAVGEAFKQLRHARAVNKVNVVIVSDHGMAPTDPVNNVINVENCIDMDKVKYMTPAVTATIFPYNESDTTSLYNQLKNCHPNMTAYLKADVPDRFHYKNSNRVGPIVVMADEGWQINSPLHTQHDSPWPPGHLLFGNHGYDNRLSSMGATFIARGPDFKKKVPTATLR